MAVAQYTPNSPYLRRVPPERRYGYSPIVQVVAARLSLNVPISARAYFILVSAWGVVSASYRNATACRAGSMAQVSEVELRMGQSPESQDSNRFETTAGCAGLVAPISLPAAANRVIEATLASTGVQFAALYVPAEPPDRLQRIAANDTSAFDERISSRDDAAALALCGRAPVYLNAKHDRPCGGLVGDAGGRAALPVVGREESLGVLCVASRTDDALSAVTRTRLAALIAQFRPPLACILMREGLSRQVDQLTGLLDNAPDLIFTVDRELRHTFVNQRMVEHTGISRSRYLGNTSRDLGMPDALCELWEATMRTVFETAEPAEAEFTFAGSSGPRHFHLRAVPQPGADGPIGRLVGITRDVTAERRAEAALRDSERRYRLLADRASDMISLHDVEGTYLYVSPASARLLGYAPDLLIGRNAYDFFHVEDLDEIRRSHATVLRDERTDRISYRLRHRSGRFVWVETTSQTYPDSDGSMRIVAVTRDISERKQAEAEHAALQERLHHAQRLETMELVAGGIAHDLNNLLTTIRGHIELSRTRLDDRDAIIASLSAVKLAAQQAGELTRTLSNYERRAAPTRQPLELRSVVDTTQRLLHPLLPKHIELRVGLEDDPPVWVAADFVQLQQVLVNLVINARDAMPEGGQLLLALSRTTSPGGDPSARITVQDTGTGIPAQLQARIFEPFFTTKGAETGTGLGLAIVRRIVAQHGGDVRVESTRGAGATFTVSIPALREAPAEPAAGSAALPSAQPLILIAEPDPKIRGLLAATLRAQRYSVVTVSNAPSLRARLAALRDQIGLLILDTRHDGEDGLRCLRELRERGNAAPAIIVARAADAAFIGIHDKHTHFLRTPFQASDVAQLAAELVRTAAVQSDIEDLGTGSSRGS